MAGAVNWLGTWLERRRLRRLVPWESCVWSPKKAAEKRLAEVLTQHYAAMARIRMDAALAEFKSFMNSVKRPN